MFIDYEANNDLQNDLVNCECFSQFNENIVDSLEEDKNFQANKVEIYLKSSFSLNDKTTNYKTHEKEFNFEKQISEPYPKNEASNDDKCVVNFYSVEQIKEILTKNEKIKLFNKIFTKNNNIEAAENKLCNRKRKRKKEELDLIEDNSKEEKKTKRGRKTNKGKYYEEHNRMSDDNIIKKIKSRLFFYSLKFLNNMMNKTNEDKERLYKLDYKYIEKMNKDIDTKLLKMPLQDLFSMDITSKIKRISSNYNQNFIQKIINQEEIVKDYDTVIFVLKMTFGEWLDMFTYKKDINYLKNKYKEYNNINYEKIENNIFCANNLFDEILLKNDEIYFNTFIFYLYNYERWFAVKSSRVEKSKRNVNI